MELSDKKIVVIGGGTGVFTVLTGLKNYYKNLTAVVTMADDGGSTGILREEFGILPPGDIRRALIALSNSNNAILSKLFAYRFSEGRGLNGHTFGNLMITALERITGDFNQAVVEAGKILSVDGTILPVTLTRTTLQAELEDGTIIRGETNIDVPSHDGNLRIKRVWLTPEPELNPEVKKAIAQADAVIIGPGDLYTSIVPNLLVSGMREALAKSRAKKIYAINLMTKFGETTHFKASDFLRVMEEYIGAGVLDYILANNRQPSPARFKPYAHEKSSMVEIDMESDAEKPTLVVADLLRPRGFLRHDPEKLAKLVRMLV
jgi:uncharacterized cofD-like protein